MLVPLRVRGGMLKAQRNNIVDMLWLNRMLPLVGNAFTRTALNTA